jgi:predicted TIM-barrel fold metal-dependent hydrolase
MIATTTRRQFFGMVSSASFAAIATTVGSQIVRADVARTPVVDTHVHCFAGRADPQFPYHPKGPYQPERASPPEHLLGCMREAGVDFAVIVHPEPYQDDHRYLEHFLQVGQSRLKGTCLFFAGIADNTRRLAELVKSHPQAIVALRIHAYTPERLPPFGKPELRELWKAAADLGLMMQLHFEPRYAPGFEPLIREYPSTRVIVDHLGRPMQGTPDEYAVVLRWSRFPNTVMKLSAIPEKGQYPHRDISPLLRQLLSAYGPERLIYGGGYSETATGESYRAHRDEIRGRLADLSQADQGKVLGGNAAKLFGFSAS